MPRYPTTRRYVTSLPSTPLDGQEVYLATPTQATPVGLIQQRRYNASAVRWDYVGSTAPYYATALPATPPGTQDGLEVYYAADRTNGIIWHLRYNALSTSAYKWEFVGGQPLMFVDYAETAGTAISTTYMEPSTSANITVPLAGEYAARADTVLYTSAAVWVHMGISVNGDTPVVNTNAHPFNTTAGYSAAWTYRKSTLGANQVIKVLWRLNSGSTSFWRDGMQLQALPIRVA